MRTDRNIPERLHTVESAADLLGSVSPSTIRTWLTEGKLTRVKVGRLTRVRESELLGLIKVTKNDWAGQGLSASRSFQGQQPTGREKEGIMYSIFGLINPSNQRVFHVGLSEHGQPQLDSVPDLVAKQIKELAPAVPQIVILQTVESRPEVSCVKWQKRFRRDLLTSDWKQNDVIANAFTNPKRARRILGEEVSSDAKIQARFHTFERKNPEVFEEMLQRARSLRDEGRDIFGVDLIICEIRYKWANTNRIDRFKIPNFLQPFYARKLQMVDPTLCGLFVMHPCVADALVLEDGRSWRDFAREHSDSVRFEGSNMKENEQ